MRLNHLNPAELHTREAHHFNGANMLKLNQTLELLTGINSEFGANFYLPEDPTFEPALLTSTALPAPALQQDKGPIYTSTPTSVTFFSEALVVTGTYGANSTIPDGLTLTETFVTLQDFGSATDIEQYSSGSSDNSSIFTIGNVDIGGRPDLYSVTLSTNSGDVAAYSFTFAGQTYFIPLNGEDFSGAATTSGTSSVPSSLTGVTETSGFMVPHDSFTFTGTAFYEVESGGSVTATGTDTLTIRDEDYDSAVNNFDFEQMFLPSDGSGPNFLDSDSLTEGTTVVSHSGGLASGINTLTVTRSFAGDD